MTPREKLAPLSSAFDADILCHEKSGFILDTPEYFMAWRTVGLDWPLERMLNPSQSDFHGTCAFLWCVSGNWRAAVLAALEITPWVQWAAYERKGRPRLVEIALVLHGYLDNPIP